jgi:uncharacterized membrane protein (DUF4010 family)
VEGVIQLIDTVLGGAVIALLVGLLLGLEREHAKKPDEALFAGVRTFPILSISGYLGALAARHGAPLVLPAVILGIGALGVASYLRSPDENAGATTEATAIAAPLVGALILWTGPLPAASIGVLLTVLLTLKAPLHRFAGAISREEILAILKFAVVAVVLVPLLPAEPLGPYGALVPRHLGIVVLILSGVSLAGYLMVKLFGGRAGWTLAGILGGLVSSTAVTLSFAGKARGAPGLSRVLGLGIVAASTVLYLRGLVVVALLDRTLAAHLAPWLLALFALGTAFVLLRWREKGGREPEAMELGNPVELSHAFGLVVLFAVILVGARAAQETLGTAGLWAVGAVAGLVDVDSVAVAASRLRQQGHATEAVAGGAFLIATVSNLLVKGAAAALVGGRELARVVLPAFAALAGATAVLLLLSF